MDEAIERGLSYRAAGADIIFPEALETADEFGVYADAVAGPLLANMTEFGKTPYLTVETFEDLGYALVVFPVTALRVAAGAMRAAYAEILEHGTQAALLDSMQTRTELYDLIHYADYEVMDRRFSQTK